MGFGKKLTAFGAMFTAKRRAREQQEETRTALVRAIRQSLDDTLAKPDAVEKYKNLAEVKRQATRFIAQLTRPEKLTNEEAAHLDACRKMLAEVDGAEKILKNQGLHAPESTRPTPRRIGATMPDGTIFAGADPETGHRLFMMPKDAGVMNRSNRQLLKVEFKSAAYAQHSHNANNAYQHSDWLLPSAEQMRSLNEAFRKEADLLPAGNYWTSSVLSQSNALMAWTGQKFSTSNQNMGSTAQIRLVRVEQAPAKPSLE